MELSNYIDHPKEYYYKVTVTGRKTFYKRTASGHIRIARDKIPSDFIDRIRLYKPNKDADILKSKKETIAKLEKTIEALKNLDSLNLSEKNYTRSKKVLQDRIASCNYYIKQCDEKNKKYSEERYKEETKEGFKKYFREKYEKKYFESKKPSEKRKNIDPIQILKDEKIMESESEDISIVRKRWKRWLVFNHPDKGGDEKKCTEVINSFKYLEEIRRN
jgi:hypothetical protein